MEDPAFAAPQTLLTIDDVAGWLNVHSRTVKRLIARRELAIKVAGATRLDPEDVRAYLEGRRVAEAVEAPRSLRRPLREARRQVAHIRWHLTATPDELEKLQVREGPEA
jgi:excisionase family DNA binding protein